MLYTTLNKIRSHGPCISGWERLLTGLGKTGGDDEPLSYLDILCTCGYEDTCWALEACNPEEYDMLSDHMDLEDFLEQFDDVNEWEACRVSPRKAQPGDYVIYAEDYHYLVITRAAFEKLREDVGLPHHNIVDRPENMYVFCISGEYERAQRIGYFGTDKTGVVFATNGAKVV